MRTKFIIASSLITAALSVAGYFFWTGWWYILGVLMVPFALGYIDLLQKKHSIRANFPVIGRLRWIMEALRPEIYQYFIESDTDGTPISRLDRTIVYERAKNEADSMPFGTQNDVYKEGYEWMPHSIQPKHFDSVNQNPRILIGNKDCTQPYSASILNISAMSFGALSSAAVEALNGGAKLGGFAHNTGEGGIASYHLKHGGDIIWQIGTGYFSARDMNGNFSVELFRKNAHLPQVKMIEIKLSQGAKPGHGGILPAKKNTREIAEIRHVKPFTTVYSPPYHSAFNTPKELVTFIRLLRNESGGKPVGFKLCIGKKSEFIAICKAMIEMDTYPDFITVDGGEGGTGAAPQEFSNYVGVPFLDALAFVENILTGFNIRKHIKLIGSGKIITGFSIVRAMALGADAVNSARGMMLALGCIQSLECNSNTCPTGVATHNRQLVAGLNIGDKKARVANFHRETVRAYAELIGAAGLDHGDQITRDLINQRVSLYGSRTYEELFPSLEPGSLLNGKIPEKYLADVTKADVNKW